MSNFPLTTDSEILWGDCHFAPLAGYGPVYIPVSIRMSMMPKLLMHTFTLAFNLKKILTEKKTKLANNQSANNS